MFNGPLTQAELVQAKEAAEKKKKAELDAQSKSGKVEISGSKNSSLSILASCLLTDKKVSISGIPKLTDTFFFLELLSSFGVNVEGLKNFKNTKKFILNARKIINNKAPYNIVKKMSWSEC